MSSNFKNLGECAKILGVTRETYNLSGIKSAYKAMAKIKHPDVGGNATEFRAVFDAYRALISAVNTGVTADKIFTSWGNSTDMFKNTARGKKKTTSQIIPDMCYFDWNLVTDDIVVSIRQLRALYHGSPIYVDTGLKEYGVQQLTLNVFKNRPLRVQFDVGVSTRNKRGKYNLEPMLATLEFITTYKDVEEKIFTVSVDDDDKVLTLEHFGNVDNIKIKSKIIEFVEEVPIITEDGIITLKFRYVIKRCDDNDEK